MYDESVKNIYLENKFKTSTIHDKSENTIGTYYLADRPNYYEPQRSNNFQFYVKFPEKYFEGLIPQNTYAETNAQEVLRIAVSEASVPHFTNEVITVKRGNNAMKFAGTPSFGEGSIKLEDYIGAGPKDVLLAWQRKVYDVETEKVGLASDYKQNAWLTEYTPDGQVVRTWKLSGCWISGLSEDSYSHESNEKRAITATIQYDKAFPYVNDIE